MSLRLIDVYTAERELGLEEVEGNGAVVDRREVPMDGEERLVRLLVGGEHTEAVLDALQTRLNGDDAARIVVTAVEATLPRPEEASEDESDDAEKDAEENTATARISREELYQDVTEGIRVTGVHYAMVVLSVLVAAGGMLTSETAVVIGAMVIAPLIGPNLALALGTTLADRGLLVHAGQVNGVGLLLGAAVAVALGMGLTVDPDLPEIASRTRVGLTDVGLALAAGVAGALSVTRGVSTALIGVMVAVALVPPLVAVGLLAGSGAWNLAGQAALLLTTNVVSVNLAAVVTFLVQGIRPMTWWEAEKAKRATRWALALWTGALALLVAAILLAQ